MDHVHKKMRHCSPTNQDDQLTAAPTANGTMKFTLSQLPQEDLMDVFTYCYLPTRCKLRRVCRYWKHVVTLKEVNQVVILNRSCRPVAKYDPALDGTAEEFIHHQHNGLLGPHVQTFIYDGADDTWHLDIVKTVYESGYYCTGIRNLIFWRIGLNHRVNPIEIGHFQDDWLDYCPESVPGMNEPDVLTVVESKFLVGAVFLPDFKILGDNMYDVEVKRKLWHDLAVPADGYASHHFEACTTAQIAWIAKYAPSLPETYHEWAKNDVSFERWGQTGDACHNEEPKIDLRSVDYSTLDPLFLRGLTFCILDEMTDVEEPPEKFDDRTST